jgi:hypothetical protein
LLTHSCELHPHAVTWFHVFYDGVGTYLAFLHKKVEINDRSHEFEHGRLEEQTAYAHIPHGGNVSLPVAVPVDPKAGGLNT